MLYFIMTSTSELLTNLRKPLLVGLLLVLAFLNLMHALFIEVQRAWYGVFDVQLALVVKAIENEKDRISAKLPKWMPKWIGTHRIYSSIHVLVGFALLVAASYMFFRT
jgi:hypothetical protein